MAGKQKKPVPQTKGIEGRWAGAIQLGGEGRVGGRIGCGSHTWRLSRKTKEYGHSCGRFFEMSEPDG